MNSHHSRMGTIALLTVVSLLATPWVTLGADDPEPASEEQAAGDGEKKGFWDRLKDPKDGKLDLTANSEGGEGFFPLALPFNEPAIGFGLVLAVGYFHPTKATDSASSKHKGGPPTTTFGGGAASTNGTWFAAAGHSHKWKDDSIRYLGAIGGGSVNLTFYGYGDSGTSEDEGQKFNIDVAGTVQQVKFRIADSPVFLGTKYTFAATDTSFDLEGVGPVEGKTSLAGLSALFDYDTRDTVFTPNKGLVGSLSLSWFDEALGGDFNYGSLTTKLRYYWPLAEHWVLGFRGDYDIVGDDAPFYALSFVKLRGVPAFRYLGNYVATIEVEPRYKIDERWSVVAFTGVGRAATEFSNMKDADKVYNYGGGFRYLLARKLGLGVGVDVARGPEDTVGYLTVGSAW